MITKGEIQKFLARFHEKLKVFGIQRRVIRRRPGKHI
jgi:hypothetical protein